MNDMGKTREQLINEVSELRKQYDELKRAFGELQRKEDRCKGFVDALTDCIYTAVMADGFPGRITGVSHCSSFAGYTPEEYLAGRNLFHETIHKDDRYAADKQISRLISDGTCAPLEHRVIHKDGSVRWVRKTLVPQYDENGTLVAYDGLLSDITRQKETELRLVQSETMSSLGVLSAGVAHEIKNPLAIILQGIELLEISLLKEGVDDVLDMMKDAVFRAGRITRDLLTFSRENTPALQEIDLEKVISETLSLVDHIFSLKQIKIVKKFSNDLPMIKVDSIQMKQVFINLLTNAAEAMRGGGTITIVTDSYENISGGKTVRIVIADTGCGISEEDKQRIFDPFYTTKKKSGGTGLGLSVVKGIIEKHKADIRIESEPGRGTSVTIEFQSPGSGIKQEVADGQR